MSKERYPYYFNDEQMQNLSSTVGDLLPTGAQVLRDINNEIGIAKTREVLSDVQKKISCVMGLGSNHTALFLTDEEAEVISKLELDIDIKEVITNGI